MRTLHISETVKGGVGNYLDDLATYQRARLGADNVLVAVPGDHLAQLSDCTRSGAIELPLDCRGPAGLLRLWRSVRAIVGQAKPDVLFLHSSYAGLAGRFQVRKLARKVIYIPHSWSFQMAEGRGERGKARLYAAIERALLMRCDEVLCVSEEEVIDAGRFGLQTEKMVPLLTGLNDVDLPSKPVEPKGQPLRVAFLGRLERQKGIDVLLETIALCDPKLVHFDIVGDSEQDPGLVQRFRAFAHVTAHGWVPRDEAQRILSQSHVLFMPSAWEGLPLTAIEAMRAAVPLLTSKISVLSTLVRKHQAGASAQVAEDYAKLLQTTSLEQWRTWGTNARQGFEADHRFDRMVAKIDQLMVR